MIFIFRLILLLYTLVADMHFDDLKSLHSASCINLKFIGSEKKHLVTHFVNIVKMKL